jgi:sigma-B regulation protein RsbU (phosphoserine phosphatase)
MTPNTPSSFSGERLSLLYHISQTFNSTLELEQVLNLVIDEVVSNLHAERGFVMLREAGGKFSFKVARGIDQKTIEDPEFQISYGIVEQVVKEEKPILTSNAQSDSRFSSRRSVIHLGLRSILCAPLRIKDKVIGAIYVDNRLQSGIFSEADLELLSAIAASAAIAIENARLYQIAVEKGRMERELEMASRVQSSLIPQVLPQVSGWDFAARWIPARQVSGDFYDYFPVDGGQLGMVIGDVVDKGMPASLFMAYSRSIIRASMASAPHPHDGIGTVNRLICADDAYGMFLTLVYAQIDPQSGEITYVNAGHNPPLYYQSGDEKLTELTRTGMLVGVEAETSYAQRKLSLMPGDFILLYTDGITEAIDAQTQPFGEQRLRQIVRAYRRGTADEIVAGVQRALEDFTVSMEPFDDITLLVIKRT